MSDLITGSRSSTVTDEGIYLVWEGVGAFLVSDGNRIAVNPIAGLDEQALRNFLLGPVLATLLHQRGMLVLHASSMVIDGRAVAFLGHSGAGKSTLAATLLTRGHGLMADDVTAIECRGDDALVLPGFPQLKLWPDTLAHVAVGSGALPRVHPALDKRTMRVAHGFPDQPVPLERIFVLASGAENGIDRYGYQRGFEEIVRHSYCAGLVSATDPVRHFLQCGTLARQVPIKRLCIRRCLGDLSELVHLVEEDLAKAE